MLEVSGVENSRRQHCYLGRNQGSWEKRLQHMQQLARILIHRVNSRRFKHLREGSFHHPAVFQDIRNSRGTPQVIFEDVNLTVAIPDEIRAGDMAPDALRRVETHTFLAKRPGGLDEILGHYLIFDDLLLVINIVDEKIERIDSLLESLFNPIPFCGFNYARDDIEWKDLFCGRVIAVHIEGDTGLQQQALRGVLML